MKETFTFNLWETVDYLNILKAEIKEHIRNDAVHEAYIGYQKLWGIADLAIYAIPDLKGKRDFLQLVQTVANEVRYEIRQKQTKHFYSLEDEVNKRMAETIESNRFNEKEEKENESDDDISIEEIIGIIVAKMKE